MPTVDGQNQTQACHANALSIEDDHEVKPLRLMRVTLCRVHDSSLRRFRARRFECRSAEHLIEFHEDNRVELYDLATDLGEQTDLSKQMPDRAKSLHAKLQAWRVSVDAQMPTRR